MDTSNFTLQVGPLGAIDAIEAMRMYHTPGKTTLGGEVKHKTAKYFSILYRRRVGLTCIPTTTGRAGWLSSACARLNGSPFLPLPPPPRPAVCFGLVLQRLQCDMLKREILPCESF